MAELTVVVFICTMAGLLVGFVIGRGSGRKSLLPLLDAIHNPPFVPPEQPQYTNYPGTQGLFLGRFRSTIGRGFDYDLYHNGEDPEVLIARHGNEGHEFQMAYFDEPTANLTEALAEALRRVRDSGL